MTSLTACTLVLEYEHVNKNVSVGNIWIYAGNGLRDLDTDGDLGERPGWVRLASSLDYEVAAKIHENLESFLTANGVKVISEGVAS